MTIVGKYEEGDTRWRAEVEQTSAPVLAATYAVMRRAVARTPCRGTVVVRLGDTEPVKLLVQDGRRVESLALYEQVEALHREARAAGVLLVLVALCELPEKLTVAVESEISRMPIRPSSRKPDAVRSGEIFP